MTTQRTAGCANASRQCFSNKLRTQRFRQGWQTKYQTCGDGQRCVLTIGAANSFPQRHPLRVSNERFHAEKTGRKPAWLSHFTRGLKIPRRKACRFDSGPGHHGFAAIKLIATCATFSASFPQSLKTRPCHIAWRGLFLWGFESLRAGQLSPYENPLPSIAPGKNQGRIRYFGHASSINRASFAWPSALPASS